MNDISSIPQPDPAWDYYLIWHQLFRANYHLVELIKYVGQFETENVDTNEHIQEDLTQIIGYLQEVIPKKIETK